MNPCLICGEDRTHSIVVHDANFQYCEDCLASLIKVSTAVIELIDKADARAVHAENLALQALEELTAMREVLLSQ